MGRAAVRTEATQTGLERRAGDRRNDAVSYALATRMQYRSVASLSAAPSARVPRWIAGPPVDPGSDDPVEGRESPSCEVRPSAWNIWSGPPA